MENAEHVRPSLDRMSTEEKVGQMLMVRYPDRDMLRAMLEAGTAGAFYFGMKGLSARQVAETLNGLQAVAKVPALIAFGSSTTSCGAGLLKGTQMRIGATRSAEIAYQVGYREALEQRAYGCHIIDAPCLDVNTNPANPIINTRAFGDDADLVTELGLAMSRGIIDGGGVTCAMHFPGHGATADDSHIRVPVDRRDADTLRQIDLRPFRRAIEAAVLNGVCTNHVHYPALAPGPVEPSTVCPEVITALLRRRLGYDGLIMSDSLTMKPMKDAFGIAESAVRAVLAGHDIILQDYQSEPAITLEALVAAVDSGRISMEQIDASVQRIFDTKGRLGLFRNPLVDLDALSERVATPEDRALARRVARESITALETASVPLRIADGDDCVVLTWGGASGSGHDAQGDSQGLPAVQWFVDGLRTRIPHAWHVRFDPVCPQRDREVARETIGRARTAIVGLFPRVVCYHEDSVLVPPGMTDLIRHAASRASQLVLLVFGNPYVLGDLPKGHATICAYDHDCPESIEAALTALFGDADAPGRLPVTIPSTYPFGAGG